MYFKKIFSFINKNGIISSLVASIIFAIVVLIISRDKSILTYKVIVNQKLFESEDNESLIILRKDSQEIKQDIYFIEIDIWNQGKKQIEEKDIKEKISFSFDDDVELLGKVMIEETHPKVTNCKVLLDSLEEKIIITFQYLERGNGMKLKAYYTSKEEKYSNLTHHGYIVEGGKIKFFNKSFSQNYPTLIAIILFFITIAFAWFSSRYVFKYLIKLMDKFLDPQKNIYLYAAIYISTCIPILYCNWLASFF